MATGVAEQAAHVCVSMNLCSGAFPHNTDTCGERFGACQVLIERDDRQCTCIFIAGKVSKLSFPQSITRTGSNVAKIRQTIATAVIRASVFLGNVLHETFLNEGGL